MGPTANLTRSQVLAAGFRKYGDGDDNIRVCLSLAYTGIMATVYSNIGKPSPPPLIIDLVPAHTQTEFNKKSGSARINASNTDVAELIIHHIFAAYNHVFIEGWDNIKLIKKVIRKLGLVSIFLSDDVIRDFIVSKVRSGRISPNYSSSRSRDKENHHHFCMHANFFGNWWPEELQQNEWQDVCTHYSRTSVCVS
jgi:hypothetical protein